jgi:hypothetical protein
VLLLLLLLLLLLQVEFDQLLNSSRYKHFMATWDNQLLVVGGQVRVLQSARCSAPLMTWLQSTHLPHLRLVYTLTYCGGGEWLHIGQGQQLFMAQSHCCHLYSLTDKAAVAAAVFSDA